MNPKGYSAADEKRVLDALGRSLLKEFPNPERIGCPGADILKRIASHKMSLSEAEKWLHHLTSCSACYADFKKTPGSTPAAPEANLACQENVKNLEADRVDGEEIDGDQLLDMIFEEGAPSLGGRFVAAQHVFAEAALSDLDAEFEQFAVDAGCTPAGILPAHLANKISDFTRKDGSAEFGSRLFWTVFELRQQRHPFLESPLSSADTTQAKGLLTFAPVGLPPTEHTCFSWTHCLAKTSYICKMNDLAQTEFG